MGSLLLSAFALRGLPPLSLQSGKTGSGLLFLSIHFRFNQTSPHQTNQTNQTDHTRRASLSHNRIARGHPGIRTTSHIMQIRIAQ